MLETVLEIGKVLRDSPDGLKHHRYIKPCPRDTDKRKILKLAIPVKDNFEKDNFEFDFDKITEMTDENIKDKLYYLTFKTSDADTSVKYVYGDIYYYRNKKNKEGGSYRTDKYSKYNAFLRAHNELIDLKNNRIIIFRKCFKKYRDRVEKLILKYDSNKYSGLFLHFEYRFGHWYQKNEIDELSNLMIEKFCHKFQNKNVTGMVFDTMLYRTLCSGDDKNDIQFPNFDINQKYKSCYFSEEDVKNLFYGINYTEKSSVPSDILKVSGAKEKIKIVIMPKGKNLGAKDYEDFKDSREDVVRQANVSNNIDTLFVPLTEGIVEQCTSFDVVFCREGANVDTDILEISSLEKSLVKQLEERERRIRLPLEAKIDSKLFIINSLLNILGDLKTSGHSSHKKYQSHLYRVLPKIYTATYYQDPVLLPAFIEKVEYKIRNEETKFLGLNINRLKYDFYFLTYIQNSKKEGENLMKIQETISYKIGFLLGQLAKQFAAWRDDCPIKSFEKSYVGTLSRRIANVPDLIKFKTFIEEKLIMHERVSFTHSISAELTETLKKLEESSEKYDKNNCAFGFFESYFASDGK